jgi:MGT family glycosyltransferase
MARFLMATMPFAGHVNPALPIARKLVERGHEVWWYTGRRYQPKVEATGARYVPMRAARDFDGERVGEEFPEWAQARGIAQFKYALKHIFLDAGVGQLEDLTAILRDFPADVLVAENSFTGAPLLHWKGGPPWAVLGSTPLGIRSRDTAPFGLGMWPDSSPAGRVRNRALYWMFNHVLFRDVAAYANEVITGLGLPPVPDPLGTGTLSPYLYLQGTTSAFEYPRSDLPPQVHFVGPILPTPPSEFVPPVWWEDLEGERPVVHVTQGTVSTEAADLLVPTLRALAEEEVLVVATTGGAPVESLGLAEFPANARVERFIPHHYLLPRVNVMVTNGGYGGVQGALAHGVPLVAAGTTEEKPEVCRRVEWTGAGINLRRQHPTPEQLRAAVRRVLDEPGFKQNARRVQADFAKHDAPTEAAVLLEQLAETRQPVPRTGPVTEHKARTL